MEFESRVCEVLNSGSNFRTPGLTWSSNTELNLKLTNRVRTLEPAQVETFKLLLRIHSSELKLRVQTWSSNRGLKPRTFFSQFRILGWKTDIFPANFVQSEKFAVCTVSVKFAGVQDLENSDSERKLSPDAKFAILQFLDLSMQTCGLLANFARFFWKLREEFLRFEMCL